MPTTPQTAFPGIYDFSLLPYALGDVLTWNVKACIRAKRVGRNQMDLYLCTDQKDPSGFHQFKLVYPHNYQLSIMELLPAFQTNPFLRNIYLFADRKSFLKKLAEIAGIDEVYRREVSVYKKYFSISHSHDGCNSILRGQVSSHKDINEYYASQKEIPLLITPPNVAKEVQLFKEKLGKSRFLVSINFRLRHLDKSMDVSEPHRNSNLDAWHEFFEFAQRKLPNVIFLFLGKLQEKPLLMLDMPNVITPRSLGYHLGHELALVAQSDLFMGSSSGFAAMANFCQVPYVITKMNPGACGNYDIPFKSSHLPFASKDQLLVYEDESSKLLLHYLLLAYQKSQKHHHPESSPTSIQTSHYYRRHDPIPLEVRHQLNQAKRQFTEYYIKNDLLRGENFLETCQQNHPSHADSSQFFQLFRSFVAATRNDLGEALRRINTELMYFPENGVATQFQKRFLAIRRHQSILKELES